MDKNQVAIPDSTISDHLTFDGGVPKINVKVELWKKRSGIKLDVAYSGSPQEGYQVSEITTSPTEITVAGSEAGLNLLTQQGNTIYIPEDRVSVDGANKDFNTEVKLTDLLPENVKLSSTMKESVVVYVTILPEGSQEFIISVDDIKTNGLDSNLTVSYDKTDIEVRVKSADGSTVNLDVSQITASIDLKGKTEGDYNLPVNVTLPSGYQLVSDIKLSLHLKTKPEVSK